MPTRLESPRAYITPELLAWARDRAGLSFENAAKRLGVTEGKWVEWEHGQSLPTLRQAETLAQKLHIPFGFLFLSVPPTINLELPDLRTVNGDPVTNPSPEMEAVVIDTLRKLEWLRDYRRIILESDPLPFVGRYTISTPVEEVAKDLNETLGLSEEIRPQASTREEFLRRLIECAEMSGVLVLRNGVVGNDTHRPLKVEEFRGFAFCDQFAPVIFINGKDARAAQVFTLVHELVHIWVNQSGLSNPDYQQAPREHSNGVERFCDSVAAETLVPRQDFLAGWQQYSAASANIRRLSGHFKVSNIVLLRRAYELKKISREQFLDQYTQGQSQARAQSPGGDGRRNVLARNSAIFTKTLVEAVLTGHTTEREAAGLLSMKVPSFDRFVKWMTEAEQS